MNTFKSALLGALTFSQLCLALVHTSHRIRLPDDCDIQKLNAAGIKQGANKLVSSGAAVALGWGGEYVMELNNRGKEDIMVVIWTGEGKSGAINASFVGANAPDIIVKLKVGTSVYVSFSPSKRGAPIPGALAPLYAQGGLTKNSGQMNDTWVEFTYSNNDDPSAVNLSKLVNMDGHEISIKTFFDLAAKRANKHSCISDKDNCVFICPNGEKTCMVGHLQNCPAGTPGKLANAAGTEGACGGLGNKKGVVVVNFG